MFSLMFIVFCAFAVYYSASLLTPAYFIINYEHLRGALNKSKNVRERLQLNLKSTDLVRAN